MSRSRLIGIALVGLFRASALPAELPKSFLKQYCYKCHGPDNAARKAKLRLDRETDSRSELKSGSRAIVPGDLKESELIYRITTKNGDLSLIHI